MAGLTWQTSWATRRRNAVARSRVNLAISEGIKAGERWDAASFDEPVEQLGIQNAVSPVIGCESFRRPKT